jgi:hypothetical protein
VIDGVQLTDIPFELDVPGLLKKLRIDGRPEYARRFSGLAGQAAGIGRPKAVYGLAYIDSASDDGIVVDGVTLTSRVLRVNVKDAHRVFPFVVTCGTELEIWGKSFTDMLERFWADAIMEQGTLLALHALTADLDRRHRAGKTAMMNPGSLADWPLDQQAPLFAILGDLPARIGVSLSDSFIMTPMKSVSGLRFPTETQFENCQLCPREECPGRRAAYDPGLYERQYAGGSGQA